MASQCLNAKMNECMNIGNRIPDTGDWLEQSKDDWNLELINARLEPSGIRPLPDPEAF